MRSWLAGLSLRAILIAAAVVALVLAGTLTVRSCDKRRAQAAQSRLNTGQAGAMSNSAADAISTVGNAANAEASSEALTRSNEQQIRSAHGADAKVDPAARDAGIAALCKRQAYANDPRCRRP